MPRDKQRKSQRTGASRSGQNRPKTSPGRTKKKRSIKPIALICIVFFVIAFGALVQQAAILRLDKQISTLQKQVDTQKALNDSKEGKIVSSQNLSRIENKAREYGMSEPTANQYVYMVPKKAKKQKTNIDYLIEWLKENGLKIGIGKK
ncbi:MAG: septum formation initiator family protein [Pseudoramibacter sp.]